MSEALCVRKTHKYVGTWKHLDEHECIGSLDVRSTRTEMDESDDGCEPMSQEHLVIVKPNEGVSDEAITGALQDHFSSHGCSHEYDCCGCRSYSVSSVHKLSGEYWLVTVGSTRNY